ncbi:disulfide bond formation protein B [Methylobacterium oryzihabitans]|uniref:Disulfide bond formation protein B n=1 Tax=Methylobacterium oryzihabitans TaxID=2499852 RepID=A0A3S2VMU0_9HYPH|nr:disulfide bond formation protein B [Methylobacterium oryzihabitans]RVU16371.1 disulfide bond formation protein B [Methylobacterium oryzihabitans]
MTALARLVPGPRPAALLVLAGAAATVGGALIFEHGFGYVPCALCLTERQPYYLALPLAAAAALLPARFARWLLAGLALLFLASAGLGAYHAGAEWGFWPGPTGCGGGAAAPTGLDAFRQSLDSVRIVDCTSAAWRFLGVSLAGWSAVISLGLAVVAGAAAWRAWRRQV